MVFEISQPCVVELDCWYCRKSLINNPLFCSKYDLYSKSDAVPDVKALTPYYEELIAKYCPGELCW